MDPFSGIPLTIQQARALGSFFQGEQKNKSRVGYYYHPDVACYQYGSQHPMKPLRIKITDTLVSSYNLKQKMFPLLPKKAYYDLTTMIKKYDIDPTVFHSDQYVDFLRQASTLNLDIENLQEHHDQFQNCCSSPSASTTSHNSSQISCSSILSQIRFPALSNLQKLQSDDEQEKAQELLDQNYVQRSSNQVVGMVTRSSNLQNHQQNNIISTEYDELFDLQNLSLQQSEEEYNSKIRQKTNNTGSRKDIYDQTIQYLKPPSRNIATQKLDQQDNMVRFNIGQDCPIFEGLYDFCMLYSAGSIFGARQLNSQTADIVMNWSGGLHHAKKNEASGFCYINDCVLGILQLLKQHQRVLYLDIDIHHGDGVEEAFYTNDRVLTCSLHKFGEYFPGTGCIKDIGTLKGQNYSINFPLNEGIDDDSYRQIFIPLIDQIFAQYKPQAVVMQCGADSVSGDRLGCFNISVRGHGMCVKHLKQKGVPMMLLGGGGYTLRNVPRCWAYETGVALDVDIQNDIPQNEFSCYFAPNNQIHQSVSNMENMNSKQYLHDSLSGLFSVLKHVNPVSVTKSPGGYYQYYGEGDDDSDSSRDDNDDDQVQLIQCESKNVESTNQNNQKDVIENEACDKIEINQ